ncbi:hypothetical protein [Bowmanella denitrificans]|uniref:hypothetical protein n=1 Tax=Bowmanella denitrificans TaxID=366582 RepID=UPI000C9C0217|nr:hypothetical protein [Bowmanella denitrificans]
MSNKAQADKRFYLCTGFHRSGTSMIAQCLAKGGMHMGNELMGASFSNPLGHVEDMPVVRLHDRLFYINGTNWQYCDDGPLIKPNWLQNYLARYIQSRQAETGLRGVKDPRALFFLKDWQVAGQQNIRYVLIYRHWSGAVQSLLNRAGRHLLNGTAPIQSNKLNYRFWHEPQLAFNMWLAGNRRMLDFYLAHQDKCLLISQEGFATGQFEAPPLADKLQLPVACLTPTAFNSQLMSAHQEQTLAGMYDTALKHQLDSLWLALQDAADIPSRRPDTSCTLAGAPPLNELPLTKAEVAAPSTSSANFQLGSLTWPELLGFVARIPARLLERQLFNQIFARPFASAEQYQTLAKVAHQHGFWQVTKLAKLRAMHVQAGHWRVAEWQLFTEDCPHWHMQDDSELPQVIPFSLRAAEERPQAVLPLIDALPHLDEPTLLQRLAALAPPAAQLAIEAVLLYRALSHAESYQQLAGLALKAKAPWLAEHALFKSLRMAYQLECLVSLGDLYHHQKLLIKAFAVFDEASRLAPQRPVLLARLAMVSHALGDTERSSYYLTTAQNLAPTHPQVKLAARHLDTRQCQGNGDTSLQDAALAMLSYAAVDYDEVVSLTQLDIKAGQELDRHNLCVTFLLRDNRAWLNSGTQGLSDASAASLRRSIQRQWRKLWPEPLLNNVLEHSRALPVISPAAKPHCGLAVYVHSEDPVRLALLLALVTQRRNGFDLIISTCEDLRADITTLCANWPGKVTIECYVHLESEPQQWLSTQTTACHGYQAVAKLHTFSSAPAGQLDNLLLAQWYGLIGSDVMLERVHEQFTAPSNIAVLVPPYYPDQAASVAGAKRVEALTSRCRALDLPEPSSLFICPADGMFWYDPRSLAQLEVPAELYSDSDFYSLLVCALAKQQGKTQSMQLL